MNILIRNSTIVTVDEDMSVIDHGCIGISEGNIAFVAETDSDVVREFKAEKTIDGTNKIVMPGLVNMHTHIPMTPLRNFGGDCNLDTWLHRMWVKENMMTEEDVYWGAYLGLAELIKSGVTAFADMYIRTDVMYSAIEQSKMRCNFSGMPRTREGIDFNISDPQEIIDHVTESNRNEDSLIKESLFLLCVYAHDEAHIKKTIELSKQLDTGIHIHISEDRNEEMKIRDKYGKTQVQLLNEWGLMDVNAIMAHCVHVTDEDIDIMKEKDANPVHCPSSNLKLGNGLSPIRKMLDKGVNVCLGTDGPGCNNNMNLIEEMHVASLIHKGFHQDPTNVTPEDIIRMSTVNGAKALGLENVTGSVKKGMSADLIVIDTDEIHLTPVNDVHAAIVYSVQATDVETVIVNGELLMEDSQLLTLDEEKAKAEVNNIAQRCIQSPSN